MIFQTKVQGSNQIIKKTLRVYLLLSVEGSHKRVWEGQEIQMYM